MTREQREILEQRIFIVILIRNLSPTTGNYSKKKKTNSILLIIHPLFRFEEKTELKWQCLHRALHLNECLNRSFANKENFSSDLI